MSTIKAILKKREMTSFLFLVLLFLVVGCINPSFLQISYIAACFNSSVVFLLISIGMSFAIIIGEIDVSVGSCMGFTATVVGTLIVSGKSYAFSFAVGILIGVIVGCVNGFGVAIMKAPSLIFTLGVNGILRGMMFIYTDGSDVNNIPKKFKDMSSLSIPGLKLTYYFVGALILAIVIHILLTRTRQGRYFKAVGDNADGARLVGINPVATKFIAYIICGVMASIAGIIFTSRIGIITTSSGNGYEMTAVAACVLGGISLAGGVGSVIGSTIGAVIMSSISYLLVFMGFSSDYNDAITGSILIVIVVIDSVMQIRSRKKLRHERLQARTRNDMSVGEGDAA
jgi:AI-2 transport system permease protein